ncbi:MAG TPA: hypothetical protein VIX19_06045 [Terriglobales bacterium]
MKIVDRVFGWILLLFGLLHTAVGVVLLSRTLNLDSAWFFSGGLAVIFCAFLNLVRSQRADRLIAGTSVIANLLLVVLSVVLWWVLRHDLKANPQAAMFVPLIVIELLFSVRQWLK